MPWADHCASCLPAAKKPTARAHCRCWKRPTASPRRSLPTKATTPMQYAKPFARQRSKSSSLRAETENTNPLTTRNCTNSETSSSDASENSKSTAGLQHATPQSGWVEARRVIYDHELILVSSGCFEVQFEHSSIMLEEHTFLIVPPGLWHTTISAINPGSVPMCTSTGSLATSPHMHPL